MWCGWRKKQLESERERGGKTCFSEHKCSESVFHVVVGCCTAVGSPFRGQALHVTLMAWKVNHDTLSPHSDTNIAVAFVSSSHSLLHNSLHLTNWSWETGSFFVSGADEQCEKKTLIKEEKREQDVRLAQDNAAHCLPLCYLISTHKSNTATL